MTFILLNYFSYIRYELLNVYSFTAYQQILMNLYLLGMEPVTKNEMCT